MQTRPNLYQYADYRQYLNDWMEWKRSTGSYSMRWFARQAGFGAPNIMRLIIDGKRNLSVRSIRRFATALQLDPSEAMYFEDLVFMNQARTPQERSQYYERVVGHTNRRDIAPMEQAQLTFFRHWLAPVIFEMISFPGFRPDAAWIAAQFTPALTVSTVKRLMKSLVESGLVQEEPDGSWRQATPNVSTGDDVQDIYLYAYHETALMKAADALQEVPMQERHYHVLTAAAPADALDELKALCRRFEEDVLRLLENHPGDKNEVFQVSLQAFPLLRSSVEATEKAPHIRKGQPV